MSFTSRHPPTIYGLGATVAIIIHTPDRLIHLLTVLGMSMDNKLILRTVPEYLKLQD